MDMLGSSKSRTSTVKLVSCSSPPTSIIRSERAVPCRPVSGQCFGCKPALLVNVSCQIEETSFQEYTR